MVRFFVALLLSVPFGVAAEQLSFSLNTHKDAVQLSVSWRDLDQNQQQLQINFNDAQLATAQTHHRYYMPERLREYAIRELQRHAQALDPTQIRIDKAPPPIHLKLQIRGPNAQTYQAELEQVWQQATARYLNENHYYLFNDPLGASGVIPDHLYYISNSQQALAPVIDAIRPQLSVHSDRRSINWVLQFVQSIPYQTQGARLDSRHDAFQPPLRVLFENRADCDSKATLALALLRGLYPKLPLAIIYMPEHAVIGVHFPKKVGDDTVEKDGLYYLVGEVSGPAQLVIGTAGEHAKMFTDLDQVTIRKVP